MPRLTNRWLAPSRNLGWWAKAHIDRIWNAFKTVIAVARWADQWAWFVYCSENHVAYEVASWKRNGSTCYDPLAKLPTVPTVWSSNTTLWRSNDLQWTTNRCQDILWEIWAADACLLEPCWQAQYHSILTPLNIKWPNDSRVTSKLMLQRPGRVSYHSPTGEIELGTKTKYTILDHC